MIAFQWFFLFLLCSSSISASTFHLVMWGDTIDKKISKAAIIDLELIHNTANEIALDLGFDFTEVVVDGMDLTLKNAQHSLDQLNINEDDIVFFYFSGHGTRSKKKVSQWPDLYLAASQERIDFDSITKQLIEYNPRFVLAIADCCNNILGKIPRSSLECEFVSLSSSRRLENLTNLFLGKNKAVIMSASIPGEYAYAFIKLGGVFTLSYLEYFDLLINRIKGVDWETIFSYVCDDVIKYQHPQIEIINH